MVLVIHNSYGRLRNQKLYRLSVTLIIFGLLSFTFYIVDLEIVRLTLCTTMWLQDYIVFVCVYQSIITKGLLGNMTVDRGDAGGM